MSFDLDVFLAAHGAGDGSDANLRVQEWARQLEATMIGSRVVGAFIRGRPSIADALRNADRPSRVVVPLLTSDGYFAAQMRDETSCHRRDGTWTVTPPIGTHPALHDALARYVVAVLAEDGASHRSTEIIVVGHGTARDEASRLATRRVAEVISRATQVPSRVAYLDDSPSVETAISGIPQPVSLLVVPFLLGGGGHTGHDLPMRVAASAAASGGGTPHGTAMTGGAPGQVRFLDPLGALPIVPELIARMVHDVRPRRLHLTVGARASALSRRQVTIAATALAPLGVDLQFVAIETQGDNDRATPLDAFETDDPFTGTITDALLSRRIDFAVHSFKDLPWTNGPGMIDAAVLPRAPAHEVLVTRTGRPLKDLPCGARVGVSGARRASQARRLHRGITPVQIRGDVPTRVAAVDRGEVDAVVLAAAGLARLGLAHRIAEHFDVDSFIPPPAQGALVIQCRADAAHRALLTSVDDLDTRRAVVAERTFARHVDCTPEVKGSRVAAAYATMIGDNITLRARLIDPETLEVWDTTVDGTDPECVGRLALERLRDAAVGGTHVLVPA